MNKAYIHALGCVTPHGAGTEALATGAPCPRVGPPQDLGARCLHGLPDAGWVDPMVPPRRWHGRRVRFGRLDRLTRLALLAAHHTVDAASLPRQRERAGVVFGTAHGSHLANEAFQLQLEQGPPEEASPSLFTYTLPSSAVGEISIHLGLQGPTITLAGQAGAGVAAVATAGRLVARGSASWLLAGAADVLGPTLLASRSRPAGSLSEGAAFVVVSPDVEGALARIAGAAHGAADDPAELEAEALSRAGIGPTCATRLVYDYRGDEQLPHEAELGRPGAAAPLLGLGRGAIAPGGQGLPALVTVVERGGLVAALCLDAP